MSSLQNLYFRGAFTPILHTSCENPNGGSAVVLIRCENDIKVYNESLPQLMKSVQFKVEIPEKQIVYKRPLFQLFSKNWSQFSLNSLYISYFELVSLVYFFQISSSS